MDIVNSNLLFKTLDAVITSGFRHKIEFSVLLRSITSVRTSRYDRVGFFLNLLDLIASGVAIRLRKLLFRPENSPFNSLTVQPLAYGSGSTVYLFEEEQKQIIVKVYRRSLGRSNRSLFKYVRIFKRKYDLVSSWYAGYNIVYPASFIILNSPLCSRPAVACIQNFIKGEKRDFFRDFSDDELIVLLNKDETLKNQAIFFMKRTIDLYTNKRVCVDFLGDCNLMIVKDGILIKLYLIDYGYFHLDALKYKSGPLRKSLDEHMYRLRALLKKMI